MMPSKSTLWLIGILISLTSGSLGFGLSQKTAIQPLEIQISSQSAEVRNLKDAFSEEKNRTDARIAKMITLIESSNELQRESIQQNSRLIDTITFQNKLLQDNYKLIQELTSKRP